MSETDVCKIIGKPSGGHDLIDEFLKRVYDEAVIEPLPKHLTDLLERLMETPPA